MYICQPTLNKMNSLKLNVFGSRLKSARLLSGLSLQGLSEKMGKHVTKQALSKYEKGLMKPSSQVLMLLSKALSIKPDYLLKENSVKFNQISFRKKTSLTKKDELSIVEQAKVFYENYAEIESILGIKNVFNNPLIKDEINDYSDVEAAALKLRNEWDLGTQPVSNIIEMLESKNIKVLLIDNNESLDGISILVENGSPIVIISKGDKSIERLRFTLIHELAHSILNFSEIIKNNEKLLEKMCHYFASCFLLPTKMLIKMIGAKKRTYIKLDELISIKNYFGISIRAIVYRLKQIQIINDTYYRRWSIWLTKTYGSKKEPGNYKGEEKSYMFMQYVNRAISEELISLSKASALTNIPIHKIKRMHEITI